MWKMMPPMAMGFFRGVCLFSLLSFLIVCGHEFINRIRPLFFHSRCLTLLSSLSFSLLLLGCCCSSRQKILFFFDFLLVRDSAWDRIDMRDACVLAHPAHLQLASTGFFWRVDWQGRATLVSASRWGAKKNSNPKNWFLFFKSGAQVSSHFFLFFLRSIWGLALVAQEQTTRGGGKEWRRRRYF